MRFQSVRCHPFGPFLDETLSLQPGMNVVFGPNEAGKSTWGAALTAGLCGIRRGPGMRKVDREFTKRHRPWNGGTEWKLTTVIELADGRQIELSQDLARRIDCSAREVGAVRRDWSSDILNDGTPDGSKWLGLDRQSFRSVACLRQGELLSLRDDAQSLQADLQRAADTGTDATAKEALEKLKEFRAEKVGSERAHTKPLCRAQRKVEAARAELATARDKHDENQKRRAEMEQIEAKVRVEAARIAAAEAAMAEQEAHEAHEKLATARRLTALFPAGAPRRSAEQQDRGDQIARAIARWEALPDLQPPSGPDASEIELQIADSEKSVTALRAVLAERQAVRARKRHDRATELTALCPDGRPRSPAEDADLDAQIGSAIREWETLPRFRAPDGPSLSELKSELGATDEEHERLTATRAGAGLLRKVHIVALAGAAAVCAFVGSLVSVMGWAGFLAVVSYGGWSFARRFAARKAAVRQRLIELSAKQRRLERSISQRQLDDRAHSEYSRRRREAEERVREAATRARVEIADPKAAVEELRQRRTERNHEHRGYEERMQHWTELQQVLDGESPEAISREAAALEERARKLESAATEDGLRAARQENLPDAELEGLAQSSAAKRDVSEARLAQRRVEDRSFAQHSEMRERTARIVVELARAVDVEPENPESAVEALRRWQEQQRTEQAHFDELSRKWDELQSVRGGRSLRELSRHHDELAAKARELARGLDEAAKAAFRGRVPAPEEIEKMRAGLDERRTRLEGRRGELRVFERELPEIVNLEEEVADAKEEERRLRDLDSILDQTIGFLTAAQKRVHRDLAPVLREGVLRWLPEVTRGRYTDCQVEPQTLEVTVSGPDHPEKPAVNLSHGATEQIYLLLRLALAEHLGKREERCPLILDDPLATSDSTRREVLLETLRTISEERQVILFTHDDDQREWAEQHLTDHCHKLVRLGGDEAPP